MTDSNRCIKVGLIGCGQAAVRGHLPALKYVPDAKVVALADIDSDRVKQVADRFGIERRYDNLPRLLDDSDVEAVAVCVPTEFHVEVGSAVLDAGKHLLIEKPLALSLDGCDRLIERADRSSCVAMIAFNTRWHRLVRKAKDIIRQGNLGQIRMIRSVVACRAQHIGDTPDWRKRREHGGGVLIEIAVHHFDLWRFLLQSEVEEVFAMSRSEESDDEIATVVARMANGALASSSFVEGTSAGHEVDVVGSEARLQLSCYCFDGLRFLPASRGPGDLRTRLRGIAHTLKELPRALLRRGRANDTGTSYQGEWRHFIDSIRQGNRPECTLVDGRRALEVVLAAAQSASLGQLVKVAEAPNNIHPARG